MYHPDDEKPSKKLIAILASNDMDKLKSLPLRSHKFYVDDGIVEITGLFFNEILE